MNWFYESAGQPQGPVTEWDFDRLIASGKVLPETLVWREGQGEWKPLREARPAPGAEPAENEARCGACGRSFPAGDLAPLGGRAICPDCKPAVLLGLQQGSLVAGAGEEERDGPAWEHRRTLGFFTALWQTIGQVLKRPTETFQRMRRVGGIGSPLLYSILLGGLGLAAGYLIEGLIRLNVPRESLPPQLRQIFANAGGMDRVILLVCLSPVIAAVRTLAVAGVLHLCLMLCRGARQPYETTLRVFSYATGSLCFFYFIPLCGGVIAFVWAIVLIVIGCARAHEISTERAVLAVLIPVALVIAFFVLLTIAAAAVIARLNVR